MNKSLLIAAALTLGTAAVAQDQPAGAPTQGSPPMTNTPSPGAPAGPESQAPAASDPAPAPAGAPSDGASPGASGGNMGQAQQMASSTDTSGYPKCSRTVTDKCMSTGKAMGGKRMTHRRHK